MLHFRAIQPDQQDRRRQARGEKVDRATRDDRDDPVAPGEFFEERDDPPGNGSATSGSATVGYGVPSKSLKIPAVAGSPRKRCEQVGIEATARQYRRRPHRTSAYRPGEGFLLAQRRG